MTLPEIEAEIARLTGEVSRLTDLRDEMVTEQFQLDIEAALADPEVRAAYAQTIDRLERDVAGIRISLPGGPILLRSPTSPEHLEWLARNNPLAGAALMLHFRERAVTRSAP